MIGDQILTLVKIHNSVTNVRKNLCDNPNQNLININTYKPGRIAHSVSCLTTDACLTADPGLRVQSRPSPIIWWRFIMK